MVEPLLESSAEVQRDPGRDVRQLVKQSQLAMAESGRICPGYAQP
jgi:hypothetical protein